MVNCEYSRLPNKHLRALIFQHCVLITIDFRYGNPSKGITGMSNRVILNGGLSALRWNRTTISEPSTLNWASAGLASNNQVSASFLKSLPPKVTFA